MKATSSVPMQDVPKYHLILTNENLELKSYQKKGKHSI